MPVQDLKPGRVIQAIRSAASTNNMPIKKPELQCIVSKVGEDLLRLIRTSVAAVDPDDGSEWRADVLDPVIEHFQVPKEFIDQDEEAEYIILQCTVVLLGYEILRQRVESVTPADEEFIIASIREFITESIICENVRKVVDLELDRLANMDVDMGVLNNVWMLSGLIAACPTPVGEHRSQLAPKSSQADVTASKEENTEKSPEKGAAEKSPEEDAKDGESTATAEGSPASSGKGSRSSPPPPISASLATNSRNLSPTKTAYFRDVHAQIFLKKDCLHELDFVKSVKAGPRILKVETRMGFSMAVEEGAAVSKISGTLDTVSVERPEGTGYELAATIIIPPGYAYAISDIIATSRDEELADWTEIETTKAHIFVGNGTYEIVPTHGKQIMVKNCY